VGGMMKYSIECKVDGKVYIQKSIVITQKQRQYIFTPNSKGWLEKIKIVSNVKNPEKFVTEMEPDKNKGKWVVTIDGDRELKLELVDEMQQIESRLSFDTMGSLKSIQWNEPQEEYIPENDVEKKQVKVSGFGFKKEYIEYPCIVDEEKLRQMLDTKDRYSSLIVLESFFRQGINYFQSKRYVDAFYNFYFILEDIYGRGKTSRKQVCKTFSNSSEFRESIDWMIKNLERDKKHKVKIQKFCQEEDLQYNTEGLIELIVVVRGNLHHFSRRSTKHHGNPFNQEEFECIAYFVLGLSSHAILRQVVKINKEFIKKEEGTL